MRAAVDRFSSLLVGWVPDLSQAPPRRRLTIGVIVSLLIHLLIFACFIVGAMVIPEHVERPVPAEPKTLEVELRPIESSPDDVPTAAKTRQILDTSGLKETTKPNTATFESDKDMRAASQLPARGNMPLPSQDGRTDEGEPKFADQDVRIAAVDTSATPASEGAPESAPPQQNQQPPQDAPAPPPPLFTPQPVAKEDLSKATAAQPTQALPEPAKQALATPPPLEKVDKPRPDQMAVSKPSPETKPGPITRLQVASMSTPSKVMPRATPAWMAMLSTPRPFSAQSAAQRYQEELKKTRIDGEITNRGDAGVDAIATPAGRWESLTRGAIGRNWNNLVKHYDESLEVGRVTIAFTVDGEGKKHDVHVEGGGNRALEAICLKAIEETPIPAPPPDMLDALPDRRVQQELSFVLY